MVVGCALDATHERQQRINQEVGMRDDQDEPDTDQCTVQDQLDFSVEELLATYNTDDDRELTPSATQYVVIAAQERLNPSGEVVSTYDVIIGGGAEVPLHAAMGLVADGQAFFARMATDPGRDSE
jgi:hypothetical protein